MRVYVSRWLRSLLVYMQVTIVLTNSKYKDLYICPTTGLFTTILPVSYATIDDCLTISTRTKEHRKNGVFDKGKNNKLFIEIKWIDRQYYVQDNTDVAQ